MLYTMRNEVRSYGYNWWQWLGLGLGLLCAVGIAI